MGLAEQKTFRGLAIPGAYAVIREIQIDYRSKTAGIAVSVYASKNAKQAGEDPLFRRRLTFQAQDVPQIVAKATALRTALYAAIKAQLALDDGPAWDWTNATDEGGA